MSETNTFEELIVMRSKCGDGTIYRQRPLVRCKDCKHGDPCNDGEIDCKRDIGTIKTTVHKPDWYCADGERRDDDD